MKNTFHFLFLLCSFHLFSQDVALEQLQQSFQESTSIESIEIGNRLYDIFYDKSEFENAVSVAQQLKEKAQLLRQPNLEAIALNQEAKALIAITEKRFKHRRLAIRKVRESQKVIRKNRIEDKQLSKSNNKLLLEAARNMGVDEYVNKINKNIQQGWDSVKVEIAEIESPINIPNIDFEKPFQRQERNRNKAQRKREQKREKILNQIMEANKKQLEVEMADIQVMEVFSQKEMDSITNSVAEKYGAMDKIWVIEKEKIEEDLAMEETKIKEMNAEEIKDELLLARYKNMYDSLAYLRVMDSMDLVKQDVELQQQESELARQKIQQSFSLLGAGGATILFLLILFSYFKQKKNNQLLSEKNLQIQAEQSRSEDLLLNILPAKVANELKQFGTAKAHKYEGVSVLFTDFKNFSQIAEQLSAEQLVAELDYCFKAFDSIIDKYGLEKIKTIGDSYMCAGGLPIPNEDNAKLAVRAAMDIQLFLEKWNEEKIKNNEPYFEARVGIHTGSIVAGVVGTKKFAYDIWGDTVNIASRMESKGEIRKVNISGTTYDLIKDDFECTFRGKIHAKNKGDIAMYFVDSRVAVPV